MRMLRKIWLDVVFGTVFIFAFMYAISNMSAFRVFDLFDPIGDALGEFEMTDIVFSQLRETPVADERIVLVNMSSIPRGEVAMMLNIINQ